MTQERRWTSVSSKTIITSLAILLSRGMSVFVLIVFMPFLYSGLGERLFGVYQLTQRIAQFGGFTNLGASSYLKIRLAEMSGDDEIDLRQKAIGSCISQWLILSPAICAWVWVMFKVVDGKAGLSGVEVAAVVVLLTLTPVAQVLSVASVALFTHGFGYRSVPVQALVSGVSAATAALAAYFGFGLFGVATCLAVGAIVNAVVAIATAMKLLPWFGIQWPTWGSLKSDFGGSWGASIASISYLGLQQIEALVFGLATTPEMLARLTLTCIGIQVLELFVRSFLASSVYAVAPLVRSNNTAKLRLLREEAHLAIMTFIALSSPFIIGLTSWVVSVWIEGGITLGPHVAAAIVLVSMFRLLAQFDAGLLDQARAFYPKVIAVVAIVFLPLAGGGYAVHQQVMLVNWFWSLPVAVGLYFLWISWYSFRRLDLHYNMVALALPICAVGGSLVIFTQVDWVMRGFVYQLIAAVVLDCALISVLLCHPQYRKICVVIVTRIARLKRETFGSKHA